VDTALSPALIEVLEGADVDPRRLARAVLRRPWLVWELIRLERHTRAAARRLAAGLALLLPSTV
jgi:hypothetical protein